MNIHRVGYRIISGIVVVVITVWLVSCTVVYFDSPQPVDSPNLKQIPARLRGHWANSASTDSITIDDNSFRLIVSDKHKIPATAADTALAYKIVHNRLFLSDSDYTTGYPFRVVDDTIIFTKRNVRVLSLSGNTILRKAKGCYILSNMYRGKWELAVIKKERSGIIKIYYPSSESVLDAEPGFDLKELQSTANNHSDLISDTICFRAKLTSRNIGEILIGDYETPYFILYPDNIYFDRGNGK
jgi:hypothetical protein